MTILDMVKNAMSTPAIGRAVGTGVKLLTGLPQKSQTAVHGALNVLRKSRAGQALTVGEQNILAGLRKQPRIAQRFGLQAPAPRAGGASQALLSPAEAAENAAMRGYLTIG